jgi:hypothetical protein
MATESPPSLMRRGGRPSGGRGSRSVVSFGARTVSFGTRSVSDGVRIVSRAGTVSFGDRSVSFGTPCAAARAGSNVSMTANADVSATCTTRECITTAAKLRTKSGRRSQHLTRATGTQAHKPPVYFTPTRYSTNTSSRSTSDLSHLRSRHSHRSCFCSTSRSVSVSSSGRDCRGASSGNSSRCRCR